MSDNALKTATDKYRPTVTPVTSVGNKSATQTGKPIFTEGDIRVSIMMPLQLHLKIEPLPRLFHVLVVTR